MWTIDEQIKDISVSRRRIGVCLNPDKGLIPGRWIAPIKWTGYVAGQEVSIIQTTPDGIGMDSYKWEKFPTEFMMYTSKIIGFIRKAMKVMD